jgi:hypothetical protein
MAKLQMDLADIIGYLHALDEELLRREFRMPVRIAIFGGFFMLLRVGNRKTTEDVDIRLLDFPPMSDPDEQPSAETKLVQTAIRAVARRYKLPQSWCNDDGAMFFSGFAPHAELFEWEEHFHLLRVYLPSEEVVLVLKFMAYRQKDQNDIQALCQRLSITTRKQAQSLLNDYVDGRWQREYMVERMLTQLFG